jgi:L-arabinonolactonase
MPVRIQALDTPRCRGGENPLWSPAEEALYFIDNVGRRAHRYSTVTGATTTWDLPDVITSLALCASGGVVVSLRSELHHLDTDSGELRELFRLPLPRVCAFNDGKVDRRGRWFVGACTTNVREPTTDGGVYRMQAGIVDRLDGDIHFSNGPAWSPDDRTFYFADSWRRAVYAYDYDIATGSISGRRVFARTHDLGGRPDGATVDADGLLWTAVYESGAVVAFTPDGQVERVVELPTPLVSSVAFGGPELDRLFVTTIAFGADTADDAHAGRVFVVDGLGAEGLLEKPYDDAGGQRE